MPSLTKSCLHGTTPLFPTHQKCEIVLARPLSVQEVACLHEMAKLSRGRDLPASSHESRKRGMQERTRHLGRSGVHGTLSRSTLQAREAGRTLSRPGET